MFTLARMTPPLAAVTAFSSSGVSCLHGPHHVAQKSTSTGCVIDAVITSSRKVAEVTSLMRFWGPPAGVAPAVETSFSMPSSTLAARSSARGRSRRSHITEP